MSEINWVDVTSYRRDEDRSSKSWELRCEHLRVVVTRHIHFPGKWILNCRPWFDLHELSSLDVEDAKTESLFLVTNILRDSYKLLYDVFRDSKR